MSTGRVYWFYLVALFGIYKRTFETEILGCIELNLMHGSPILMVLAMPVEWLPLRCLRVQGIGPITPPGVHFLKFRPTKLINGDPRLNILG